MFEVETQVLYQEPCDCGSQIRHNNGGNYHSIVRLYTYVDCDGDGVTGQWAVVLERTTTREDFPREEYETLIPNKAVYCSDDEYLILEPEDRLPETVLEQSLDHFRRGEAEIIAQS